MSAQPLTILGWLLLIGGGLLYLGNVISAVARVGTQYSRAMRGLGGLGLSAALGALARYWYYLLAALVGAALLLVAR